MYPTQQICLLITLSDLTLAATTSTAVQAAAYDVAAQKILEAPAAAAVLAVVVVVIIVHHARMVRRRVTTTTRPAGTEIGVVLHVLRRHVSLLWRVGHSSKRGIRYDVSKRGVLNQCQGTEGKGKKAWREGHTGSHHRHSRLRIRVLVRMTCSFVFVFSSAAARAELLVVAWWCWQCCIKPSGVYLHATNTTPHETFPIYFSKCGCGSGSYKVCNTLCYAGTGRVKIKHQRCGEGYLGATRREFTGTGQRLIDQ
ncbi:hypothetical protein B0H66DRAFT_41075 [Apodospora peruviana]|uniref:Uncharacterized protein n=1 Tax=Apodospora peruviana TaxID=516989 RepID=A0AAE0MES6_9PEZI|nr:hypothetical protein B0H66DRAFT_41075 [Apodospora peruviana]